MANLHSDCGHRFAPAGAMGIIVWLASGWPAGASDLRVSPTAVQLDRPEASQQVLVTEFANGQTRGATHAAMYAVEPNGIAAVTSAGLVRPLAEGTAQLVVRWGAAEVRVPVTVGGLHAPPAVSFVNEIMPLLTKGRCNSGGCHGKAEGQNGFKLSLLGFDPEADYGALLHDGRGRRVFPASPSRSLLIQKAAALMPHGGGRKLEPGSPELARVQRWIAEGAPFSVRDEQPISGIEVEPATVVMQSSQKQQLRVTAIGSAGLRRCVTIEAGYYSNADHIVVADGRGLLQTGDTPGEAAVLVRYLGHVAVCRVTLPRANAQIARPAEHNFIDRLVWDKLIALGIPPSELADDEMFLRRVTLDTIGALPTAAEARRFLTDTATDKRQRWIDELLSRSEYADYWAMKWSDLLRTDKIKITPQGAVGMTRWLRKQFVSNRPYDEIVREILTAQGPVQGESPAAFFKSLDAPEVASRSVSQLFLGVRIECAQCHHHPSERWGQDDYAGLAGFFTGLSIKKLPDGTEAIASRGGNSIKHPRTKLDVPAQALGAPPAVFAADADRRQALADWMTAADNSFFAAAIVNRLWAHYFSRGLVEPIDDLRVTNPPVNEPLMAALVAHMKEVRFDLRAFTRTLLTSRAYQLSSATNDANVGDRQHFSHAQPKVLPAEVLLDAISQVTGVPEKFEGWPLGVKAIQVWDNRMPSFFFRVFGRPARATVCECERSNVPSISQALHLINSPEVNAKIGHRQGIAKRLADSPRTVDELIAELYLTVLSRFPKPDELALFRPAFESASSNRRQAVEDVLWTLLNTKEFVFNQ